MKKMIHRFLALLCFIALRLAVFAHEKKTVTGVVKDNVGKALEGATIREKAQPMLLPPIKMVPLPFVLHQMQHLL